MKLGNGLNSRKPSGMDRREFGRTAGAAAAGFLLVTPKIAFGTQANSAVRFGILGIGGRGRAVGSGFVTSAGARVTALADFFADSVEAGRAYFDTLRGRMGFLPSNPRSCSRASTLTSGLWNRKRWTSS